jgi:aryl-alcohol dehydrogenase-like predicted oxidoreductase
MFITPVGVGTAPIGSTPSWSIYWGPQDEREAIQAIEAAIDHGINWIDTAPFYGWGRAEQIVGNALRGKRDRVYVFTKCGTLRTADGGWSENLRPQSIRQEIESSLRNLQMDYVDLYQFHDPDPGTPIEESLAAVDKLIQQGKVRYVGLSNHPCDLIQRAAAFPCAVSQQEQYSLLARGPEEGTMPCSSAAGLGFLAWSPLASGFLVDRFDPQQLHPEDFRRRHPFGSEPRWSQVQELRAALASIARAHNRSMADVAIAWILHHPQVTGAIVGIRNAQEARLMVSEATWLLPEEDMQRLDEISRMRGPAQAS